MNVEEFNNLISDINRAKASYVKTRGTPYPQDLDTATECVNKAMSLWLEGHEYRPLLAMAMHQLVYAMRAAEKAS